LTLCNKHAYNRQVKKKTAVEHFGGVAALAEALKITPAAIYQWGQEVPAPRAYQIEVLTRGKLKAREEARA